MLAAVSVAPAANAQQDANGSLLDRILQFSGSTSAVQQDTPQVRFSATTVSEAGEHEITVTGTGFADESVLGSRPPLAGKNPGVYVVLGKFADQWKPSEDAPSSARTVVSQKWAVPAADIQTIGGPERGAVELSPDGDFSVTFAVSKALADGVADKPGNFGIYTYPGGGAKHAPWETYQAITFGEPAAGGSGSLGSLTGLFTD